MERERRCSLMEIGTKAASLTTSSRARVLSRGPPQANTTLVTSSRTSNMAKGSSPGPRAHAMKASAVIASSMVRELPLLHAAMFTKELIKMTNTMERAPLFGLPASGMRVPS